MKRSWEQYPNESNEAFAAFNAFLNLIPPRKSLRLSGPWPMAGLSKWYREHRWEQRARDWDAHVHGAAREEFVTAVRKAAADLGTEYAQAELDAVKLAQLKIRKALRDEMSTTETTGTKIGEVVRAVKDLQHCSRLARGESTDIISNKMDLSALSPEELERLDEILSKTEPPK